MLKKSIVALILASAFIAPASAQDEKTKFYNFDDLLINGAYQKPQVMYTDSRKKVQFEALLKLKRDFLKRLIETASDVSLR